MLDKASHILQPVYNVVLRKRVGTQVREIRDLTRILQGCGQQLFSLGWLGGIDNSEVGRDGPFSFSFGFVFSFVFVSRIPHLHLRICIFVFV